MSTPNDVEVRLAGNGECDVVHGSSGATLRTSMSPAYGGSGGALSSTDLVTVALATCIATNIEPVALRNGIALERIRVGAAKTLGTAPKRITALDVRVEIDGGVDDEVKHKLYMAAHACAVHRSLHSDVEVTIEIGAPERS